jgi:hypothetical protein
MGLPVPNTPAETAMIMIAVRHPGPLIANIRLLIWVANASTKVLSDAKRAWTPQAECHPF